MSISFAIFGGVTALVLAVISHLAVRQAEQTGRARFLFWHVRGWGEREVDPPFFDRVIRFQQARTLFLGLLALLFVGYFLEGTFAFN